MEPFMLPKCSRILSAAVPDTSATAMVACGGPSRSWIRQEQKPRRASALLGSLKTTYYNRISRLGFCMETLRFSLKIWTTILAIFGHFHN